MTVALAHSREAAARHEREANEALLGGDRTVSSGESPHPKPHPESGAFVRPEGDGLSQLDPDPGDAPINAETIRHLLALRGIAPFDTLTEGELLLVAQHVRFRRFAPESVLLSAGHVGEMLFVTVEGQALTAAGPAPAVFDAASALFGLPARNDYRAGPEGLGVLCLAKPHLFTIARECPDFIVGLAAVQARVSR
jgi:hypothetical protein